jgi:hypothetical protein
MRNPLYPVALLLYGRGGLLTGLGILSFWRAAPALLDASKSFALTTLAVGTALLIWGIRDLMAALRWSLKLRLKDIGHRQIGAVYGTDCAPQPLLDSGGNPNAQAGGAWIRWFARIHPKLGYLPIPYKVALESGFIAILFVGLTLAGFVLLRVVLQNAPNPDETFLAMDWYQSIAVVIALAVWVGVRQRGFASLLKQKTRLTPTKISLTMAGLLLVAVFAPVLMIKFGGIPEAPELGQLPEIVTLGTAFLLAAIVAGAFVRARNCPEGFSVSKEAASLAVERHPSDVMDSIRTFAEKGQHSRLRNSEINFEEMSAVSAGKFEAHPRAERRIAFLGTCPSQVLKLGALLLTALGVVVTAYTAFAIWSNAETLTTMRTLEWLAMLLFGSLAIRLGFIPQAEMLWKSEIIDCLISGSFQSQGGMPLMRENAPLRGGMLTRVTLRARCAKLVSISFFQPNQPVTKVFRYIYKVAPADDIITDLLGEVRQRNEEPIGGIPLSSNAQLLPPSGE